MEETVKVTESSEITTTQLDNTDIAKQEVSNMSVRISDEEKEKLEKEIDEALDNMTDDDAARVVDQVVDLIKNIKKFTPAQKREENLAKMEKEYEELSEDNYKKKQLANKIYWLRKKMFPKLVEKAIIQDTKEDK